MRPSSTTVIVLGPDSDAEVGVWLLEEPLMWPDAVNARVRMARRLVQRLDVAYHVEDLLPDRDRVRTTLDLLREGLLAARDDPVLYATWTERPVPARLGATWRLEERLWFTLGGELASLAWQGLRPEYFTREALAYAPILTWVQSLLPASLSLLRNDEDPVATDTVARVRAATGHYGA